MRFFRHRLAVASLIVLVLIGLVGVFAPQLAPYGYDELDLDEHESEPPTLEAGTSSAPTSSDATT